MVDMFLDFMLGPLRGIGTFYFEHQTIFNTIIVSAALYKLVNSKRKETAEKQTN